MDLHINIQFDIERGIEVLKKLSHRTSLWICPGVIFNQSNYSVPGHDFFYCNFFPGYQRRARWPWIKRRGRGSGKEWFALGICLYWNFFFPRVGNMLLFSWTTLIAKKTWTSSTDNITSLWLAVSEPIYHDVLNSTAGQIFHCGLVIFSVMWIIVWKLLVIFDNCFKLHWGKGLINFERIVRYHSLCRSFITLTIWHLKITFRKSQFTRVNIWVRLQFSSSFVN